MNNRIAIYFFPYLLYNECYVYSVAGIEMQEYSHTCNLMTQFKWGHNDYRKKNTIQLNFIKC